MARVCMTMKRRIGSRQRRNTPNTMPIGTRIAIMLTTIPRLRRVRTQRKTTMRTLTRHGKLSAGGHVVEFNTRTTALSQICLCGQKHKKRLSERIHACDCGVTMQRDLFSAYLASFVEDDALQVAKAAESWPGAEPLLRLGNRRQSKTNLQVDGSCRPPLAAIPAARVRAGRPRKKICRSIRQRML